MEIFSCSSFFSFAVDIISAIEFDTSGDYLATGDRGGRVVLFERTDSKDVCFFSPCRLVYQCQDMILLYVICQNIKLS